MAKKTSGKQWIGQEGVTVTALRPAGEIDIGGVRLPVLQAEARRVTVDAGPLYRPWREPETENVCLTLIPYFAWANRGLGEMCVWLHC